MVAEAFPAKNAAWAGDARTMLVMGRCSSSGSLSSSSGVTSSNARSEYSSAETVKQAGMNSPYPFARSSPHSSPPTASSSRASLARAARPNEESFKYNSIEHRFYTDQSAGEKRAEGGNGELSESNELSFSGRARCPHRAAIMRQQRVVLCWDCGVGEERQHNKWTPNTLFGPKLGMRSLMSSRECCHHSSSIKPTFNESFVGRRLRRDGDIAPYRLGETGRAIRPAASASTVAAKRAAFPPATHLNRQPPNPPPSNSN